MSKEQPDQLFKLSWYICLPGSVYTDRLFERVLYLISAIPNLKLKLINCKNVEKAISIIFGLNSETFDEEVARLYITNTFNKNALDLFNWMISRRSDE